MAMKLGKPRGIYDGENGIAMTPDSALQLQKLGYERLIEKGPGGRGGKPG
ncbi:hypothetical protein [Ruegeria atlantica]|nr:hypothetical protein [Ruegeria atlantica]